MGRCAGRRCRARAGCQRRAREHVLRIDGERAPVRLLGASEVGPGHEPAADRSCSSAQPSTRSPSALLGSTASARFASSRATWPNPAASTASDTWRACTAWRGCSASSLRKIASASRTLPGQRLRASGVNWIVGAFDAQNVFASARKRSYSAGVSHGLPESNVKFAMTTRPDRSRTMRKPDEPMPRVGGAAPSPRSRAAAPPRSAARRGSARDHVVRPGRTFLDCAASSSAARTSREPIKVSPARDDHLGALAPVHPISASVASSSSSTGLVRSAGVPTSRRASAFAMYCLSRSR